MVDKQRAFELYMQGAKVKGEIVPLVIYEGGRRNQIGTAEIQIWPGETRVVGTLTAVIPIMVVENIAISDERTEDKGLC